MKILNWAVYVWRMGRLPSSAPVGICPRCYLAKHLPVIAYVNKGKPFVVGPLDMSRAQLPVCLECAEWGEIK